MERNVGFRFHVSDVEKEAKNLPRNFGISLPTDASSCRRRRQISAMPLRRQQDFLNPVTDAVWFYDTGICS